MVQRVRLTQPVPRVRPVKVWRRRRVPEARALRCGFSAFHPGASGDQPSGGELEAGFPICGGTIRGENGRTGLGFGAGRNSELRCFARTLSSQGDRSQAAPRRRVRARSTGRLSDAPLKPLYEPADVAHLDLARDLGVPGEFPYTRGIHPNMYRERLWTMRQFAGFGNAQPDQRALSFLARAGPDGALGRLRHADAHGLRLRSPRRRGRSRQVRRGDRLGRATWRRFSRASTWARSPRR